MIMKGTPPRFQVGDLVRCTFTSKTYGHPFEGVITAPGYASQQWKVARDLDGKHELMHENFMVRIGRPEKS